MAGDIINILLPFIPIIFIFIYIKRSKKYEYDSDILFGNKCYNCKLDITKDFTTKFNNIINGKKHTLCKSCVRKETLNSLLHNKIITSIKVKKAVLYLKDKTSIFIIVLIIGLLIDILVTGINIIAPTINTLFFYIRFKYNKMNEKSPSDKEGL